MRSIGKANEVAKLIFQNPKLFRELFKEIMNPDPLIRMRAADAAEKISKQHPEYLQPFKKTLIETVAKIPQQEVRWHAAQMFSYITLTPKERILVSKIIFSWLENEKSNIVRVMSLQTLASLSKQDRAIKHKVTPLLQKFLTHGIPSLKSRSRKLLKELGG